MVVVVALMLADRECATVRWQAPKLISTHLAFSPPALERWRGHIRVALSAGLAAMGLREECLVRLEGEGREAGKRMPWCAETHCYYGYDGIAGSKWAMGQKIPYLGCKAS
jgi:hypothetical protein